MLFLSTSVVIVSQKFHVDAGQAAERGAVISLAERIALVASTSTLTQEHAIEICKPLCVREAVITGAHRLEAPHACARLIGSG
jgi:hypothetical protein